MPRKRLPAFVGVVGSHAREGVTFSGMQQFARTAFAERLPWLCQVIDGVAQLEAVPTPDGSGRTNATDFALVAKPPSLARRLEAFVILRDVVLADDPDRPDAPVLPPATPVVFNLNVLSRDERRATLHALRKSKALIGAEDEKSG